VKRWQMLFSGSDYLVPPEPDEVELSLIGPGFGEAVCVHIGDGKWCAIDSCVVPGDGRPTTTRYLNDVGFSSDDVFAVVASHWDDDHIRGFARLVSECTNAAPVMSLAFSKADVMSYLEAYGQPLTTRARSGVREIRETFEVLRKAGRTKLRMAGEASRIYGPGDIALGHGHPFELWTLSPSSEEYENFLTWLAGEMPKVRETRRVAVSQIRNDLSVVAHISVGDVVMLIGGDLEHRGWSALIAGTGRPTQVASAYKVAHHGSISGDHPQIWADLLGPNPVAVLAPWRLGGGSLPTKADATRIIGLAPDAYSTTLIPSKPVKSHPPLVKRQLRAMRAQPVLSAQVPGMIRMRRKLGGGSWRVETFGGALHLSSAHV
jgi:hypothetical protein